MLWFYISALAVLVGAEMNAEVEHASPHGKEPGEKVPGEKKKLGARAARAFKERGTAAVTPSPSPVSRPTRPTNSPQPAPAAVWYVPAVAIFLSRWIMGKRKV